MIQFIIIHFS